MGTINVRNVNYAVYRKFRGKCAELDKPTGEAVTEAIEMWLEKYEKESRCKLRR